MRRHCKYSKLIYFQTCSPFVEQQHPSVQSRRWFPPAVKTVEYAEWESQVQLFPYALQQFQGNWSRKQLQHFHDEYFIQKNIFVKFAGLSLVVNY